MTSIRKTVAATTVKQLCRPISNALYFHQSSTAALKRRAINCRIHVRLQTIESVILAAFENRNWELSGLIFESRPTYPVRLFPPMQYVEAEWTFNNGWRMLVYTFCSWVGMTAFMKTCNKLHASHTSSPLQLLLTCYIFIWSLVIRNFSTLGRPVSLCTGLYKVYVIISSVHNVHISFLLSSQFFFFVIGHHLTLWKLSSFAVCEMTQGL
jgi:hypothetical protein